jgi:hypothetical protein
VLVSQRGEVGDAFPATGQHDRQLGEQPTAIMSRGALASPRDRDRISRSEPRPIGQFTQKMQPNL